MEEKDQEQHDHRKIGQELDLFTFSDLVGSGLPLWTPKGTVVRTELDKFVWDLRSRHDYSRVTIPHITKKDLYETSGHWDKYSDDLFRITSREGREYALKPMNCPHHTQIFARKPHSYREMPQRYAETTMVYRDEQSGELGGLTRVLSITQDDSHVFCRTSQIKEEFLKIWDIVDTFYKTFGFTLQVRLSFRDLAAPEKYLGKKSGTGQKTSSVKLLQSAAPTPSKARAKLLSTAQSSILWQKTPQAASGKLRLYSSTSTSPSVLTLPASTKKAKKSASS